ncbi:MAG TPA: putative sulfate exporter family transporter, partial [Trueperaceae bacterium]|nr:putative sulfate exporter family transporter [Trueperaceae bacterium]
MTLTAARTRLAPGLALVGALAVVSYLVARVPFLAPLGPLVLAMVVGMVWRAAAGMPTRAAAGTAFAARDLLRVGIVLLGVRLDFGLVASVGPVVVLGSVMVVGLGVWAISRLGRALGLPPGLRLAIAVGTSICGASAVLAAASATRIDEEEAGVAVGIISLVGTVGVVGFTLLANVFQPDIRHYALVVGLTLQEVAQVVAAGYVPGAEAGDLATVAKLTRVALLAPALFVIASLVRSAPVSAPAGRRLPVPSFLLGFLAMGVITSLGWLPPGLAHLAERASLFLTCMAMVAIGL